MLQFGILTVLVGLAQAAICHQLLVHVVARLAALLVTAFTVGIGVAAIISSREKPTA